MMDDQKAQARQNLIIGGRLREGRLLCNHTITQAAGLLGITKGELEAAEAGFKDKNRAIPHKVIFDASFAYDVSIDFIYGACGDEWEVAEDVRRERDLLTHLSKLYLSEAIRNGKAQERLDKRLKAVEWSVTELAAEAKDVRAKFSRFMELNQDFDDRLGGNSLLKSIERAENAANAAICSLVRYKALPAKFITPQPEPAASKSTAKCTLKSTEVFGAPKKENKS